MGLKEVEEYIGRCMHCGSCVGRGPYVPYVDAINAIPYWICPSLDKLKFLTYTARGRLILMRKVIREGLPIDEDMVKAIYTCTGCGICNSLCSLPILKMIRSFREEILKKSPSTFPEKCLKIDSNIKENHNFFGATNFNRTKWSSRLDLSKKGEILYFVGCYSSFRQPEIPQAVVKILEGFGLEVVYLGEEEWCCGLHCGWDGNTEIEKEMARHNLEAIKRTGAKKVLFSCASCYRTFKDDYPEILGNLPFELFHTVEIIQKMLKDRRVEFKRGFNGTVSYHDPCHLIRGYEGDGKYQAPREILSHIPGLKFQEMKRNGPWAYCCGKGALVTASAFPEVASSISFERLSEAKDTANTLITTCPHCIESFKNTARREGIDMNVQDLSVLTAYSLGLECSP